MVKECRSQEQPQEATAHQELPCPGAISQHSAPMADMEAEGGYTPR